ncbi:GHKL domain-containing protein [bacterium]|nr:GHKL domain-containing protein [bacterium]
MNTNSEQEKTDIHHRLERDLMASRHQLGERVKELKCLYAISRLVQKQGIALDEMFKGALQFIPPAWQYPEIACAKINLGDAEYKTANYRDMPWKQSRDIVMNNATIGVLEVGYLEERPASHEGPFLQEERALINTIADRLGKAAEYIEMRSSLEESEISFRDLVENSLIGIVILQDGLVAYMNSEQRRISAELPLAFSEMHWNSIHVDDVERVKQGYEDIVHGRRKRINMDFRFSTNSTPVEMKWVYWRANIVAYQGKDAVLFNMLDVSRSKHLESLLRVKDKMASLGHVTAGIAHEIRNPLSGINIYLNALDKINHDGAEDEQVHQIIRQMQSASGKIESIIKRVMDFSRPTEPKRKWIHINAPIEEAAELSSVTLSKIGIKLTQKLEENLPLCYADALLLEQVLLNLITNAAEAMKENRTEKIIAIASSLKKDRFRITVSDSGPGVPNPVKEKIFDPFYSTKSGNTGIGLSLGHRIITDHGGTLDVEVSRWSGAQFVIEIPLKQVDK